jgi:long-subunit fatty acid transport protein
MRRPSPHWRPAPPLPSLLCTLVSLCFGAPAHAGVTDNVAVNPVAMSLGNAVTADPPGIGSIHFNPAGLARLTGLNHLDSLFVASIRSNTTFHSAPDIDIGGFKDDPINGTSTGQARQALAIPFANMLKVRLPAVVVPGLGIAYNAPGSPFTFATQTYLSQAFSLDRTKDPNDPGRFDGSLVHLQRLVYLSPAVGYKVSDTLRLGVSVPIAYANMAINTDFRAPNKLLGTVGSLQKGVCPNGNGTIIDTLTFGLCGGGKEGMVDPFKRAGTIGFDMHSSFDPTINLGLLWEPKPWFGFGIALQGGATTAYRGQYSFHSDPMLRQFVRGLNSSLLGPIVAGITALPSEIPELQTGNMHASVPFPAHLQMGIKFKPIDQLQINVDVSYADWNRWKSLTFEFDRSIKLLEMARLFGFPDASKVTFPMGFRSVVNYGVGLQSEITPAITLRAGFEPRKSSIPADKISLITPLPDTTIKSLGLRYRFHNGAEVNVAGSYMKGRFAVPARTDCNLNCDGFFNIIYNPYAATDVKGDFVVRYFGVTFNRPF